MLACRGPCTVCTATWWSEKARRICPRCSHARTRAKHPARRAAYDAAGRLKRRYGLTVVQYLAQVNHQRGRCASCGTVPPIALSVDHSHETGAIRELLCNNCNVALGYMRESPDNLRRLANYIERH